MSVTHVNTEQRMNHQDYETGAAMVAKVAPPATVAGASLAGVHVSDWVLWMTLVYTILMICHKLWQMGLEAWRFWKKHEQNPNSGA